MPRQLGPVERVGDGLCVGLGHLHRDTELLREEALEGGLLRR